MDQPVFSSSRARRTAALLACLGAAAPLAACGGGSQNVYRPTPRYTGSQAPATTGARCGAATTPTYTPPATTPSYTPSYTPPPPAPRPGGAGCGAKCG